MDGVSSPSPKRRKSALNASTRIIIAPAKVAGFVWASFAGFFDPNCSSGFTAAFSN
jgi:hypothetical protein